MWTTSREGSSADSQDRSAERRVWCAATGSYGSTVLVPHVRKLRLAGRMLMADIALATGSRVTGRFQGEAARPVDRWSMAGSGITGHSPGKPDRQQLV